MFGVTPIYAHQAAIEGNTAPLTSAEQLLNDLCAHDSNSTLRRGLPHYERPHLLVDEVASLSNSRHSIDPMFELVSRLYQLRSTLIVGNRPFAEWREIPSMPPASSHRLTLVHNAKIIAIEGHSYCVKIVHEPTEQRAR